ncbi:LysR substrate-binding domain-containing protein [Sphingopyxis sp. USTB-05]|jgi:DNA-binding transcriptional LysR family regulator|uniref:LysR substrate-binding domain-containing protein n=2 Tax=unclassified Sphingopyxis TaxID=2614943 RepID=UPI0007802867|nr:LysR substrate-binding domain-containing protein [Sphingopyxis sp. USTB-05]USI77344.1 LysR family transcriptional regulator [Sphingopyxis sp. USTB-05]
MMLDLGDLQVFSKIVETESLTKAGQALGLPKSTVSRRISRLEENLGVQLLHRSTRSVTVTEDGAMFFEYCLRSLGVLRDGERALQNRQNVPRGVVKIAIPYVLGQSLIGPLLASFLDLYPDVRLVSVMTDDAVGLLRAGFDVALAVGPFADSELVAVKLGVTECGLFGAPGYFERKGMPQNHVELPRFDLLATGTVDRRQRWPLHTETEQVTVEFSPRLVCNDLNLLRHAVRSELGIATLPAFLCKSDLAEGKLVEVLPGWQAPDMSFYALFADPKGVPVRVRSLIDYLTEKLRPTLSWEI